MPAPQPQVPVAVLAATALFALVLGLWTVAVPQGRAPDEMAHFDLVLALAEDTDYPDPDGRLLGRAASLSHDGYSVDLARPWPRYAAEDAPPRSARDDVHDRGGIAPDPRAGDPSGPPPSPFAYNQQTQHPPLYYAAMATVLDVERALVPGDRPPPLDRELGLLRWIDALLLVPLPLLAWLTTRRMGGSSRAGTVAAFLPLGLPQLTHVGGSLNNDNLLALLAAILAVLLAGVARGRRSGRTDLLVGLVVGLTLWTKALAFALLPWVAAAYLVAWSTARAAGRPGGAVARGARNAVVVAVATGSWWWVLNVVRHGRLAPTSDDLTRTSALRPAGHDPDPIAYAATFTGRLLGRTWAWIGFGEPKVELKGLAVAVLAGATLAAVVVAVRSARGRSPAGGVRRVDVLLALVPLVAVALFIAQRAWSLHVRTGGYAFIQGRYLFCAVVPVMAVVAIAADRVLGHRGPAVALGVVVALQRWALGRVVTGFWAGDGPLGQVGSLLAWSPWPAPLVLAATAATLASLVLAAWSVTRPETGVP